MFNKLGRSIKLMASLTFSIYLLHYPFMSFFYAIYNNSVFVIIMTVIFCVVIGIYIENTKFIYKKILFKDR